MLTGTDRREIQFCFDTVPRYWFGGSPFKTHFLNAVHILLFHGERYMMRTLADVSGELHDPEIRAQVRWFMRQEGDHAAAHRRFWDVLAREGIAFEWFSRLCQWVGDRLLPRALPARVNLAMSVAIEHLTSVFADAALRDRLFDASHPEPRKLLEWHAAEEIEHKTVVFDVLTATGKRPFALRVLGMGLAMGVLGSVLAVGTAGFLLRDPRAGSPLAWARDAVALFLTREAILVRGLRGWLVYFNPGFHPRDIDSTKLAQEIFERHAV